jgi:hypothetical protein
MQSWVFNLQMPRILLGLGQEIWLIAITTHHPISHCFGYDFVVVCASVSPQEWPCGVAEGLQSWHGPANHCRGLARVSAITHGGLQSLQIITQTGSSSVSLPARYFSIQDGCWSHEQMNEHV